MGLIIVITILFSWLLVTVYCSLITVKPLSIGGGGNENRSGSRILKFQRGSNLPLRYLLSIKLNGGVLYFSIAAKLKFCTPQNWWESLS